MSTWVILSWVFVAILTAINIFIFLKLKQASEQMLKMAFPGTKNMNEALGKMQQMMGGAGMAGMPGMGRGAPGFRPGVGGPNNKGGKPNQPGQMDSQLKAAMDMLQKMQKGGKR